MRGYACAIWVIFALWPITAGAESPTTADPYLWLEPQHDPAAVAWAKERSDKTRARLMGKADFPLVLNELERAQRASAPIPTYTLLGDTMARFTRDAAHPAGLLEIAHRTRDGLAIPEWRTVIDLEELNRREGKNYEFLFLDLAQQCLPPAFVRCLLPLSPGGSSSTEHREFDLSTAKFVADGFNTPLNRSQIAWLNADTVLVSYTLEGSPALNSSNPAILRIWKRGTPLSAAKPIFQAAPSDSLFFFRTMGEGASSKAVLSVGKGLHDHRS
jgi:prolyl oligopeptidase